MYVFHFDFPVFACSSMAQALSRMFRADRELFPAPRPLLLVFCTRPQPPLTASFSCAPQSCLPGRVLPVALSSAAPRGVLRRAGLQAWAVHMLLVSCCGPWAFLGETLSEYADTRSFFYRKAFSTVPACAEFSSST